MVTLDERLNRSLPLAEYVSGQPEVEASVRETLGGVYFSLGQYDKAEEQARAAFRLNAQALGPEHRDTLRVVNLLVSLLDQTGRRGEALPIMRGNLETCRCALGPDDEVTLDATERLGLLLWHVGKLDEAESLLRRNADDRRRLQPNSIGLMRSTFMLSRFVRDRGGIAEAEKLASQYEHDVRCALGPDHFENVVALINRGDLNRDQGKFDRAESLFHHAAVEAARILGREHPTALAAQAYYDRFVRQTRRPVDATDGARKSPPLAQLPGDVFAPRESIAPHSR